MKNWIVGLIKRIFKRPSQNAHNETSSLKAEAATGERPNTHIKPESGQGYNPKPGQPGRNVEWVPASSVVINRMYELAKVTPDDYVIDPGSGDGRMVISAAKLGARATGIEFNPRLIELARKNAAKEGVGDRATFIQGNLFQTDFSTATVIALFLREDINIALRPRILETRPGTRVVSNIFHMRDWEADEVVEVEDKDYYFKNHTVYLWIVPAKAGGTWILPMGELKLDQKFQIITGVLGSNNEATPVSGRMTGDRISFTAGERQYTGHVTGDLMELEVDNGERVNGERLKTEERG